MNIFHKARKLESRLARTVDRAAQRWSGSGPRGPLEIRHAVLEAIEKRLEPAGRGTHVFPFNAIKLWVVAASRDERARFAGVLDSDPSLHERVCDRLRAAGCDGSRLRVRVVYVAEPDPAWPASDFHIDFSRVSHVELPPADVEPIPEIKLTMISGSGDKPAYVLRLARINLGRCAEVRDSRNRLIRTNHVVFKDGADGNNDTVSRRHAHIEYDEGTKGFRIADDRSAHGTAIVRNGTTIGVPPGSRGVRLQSDDEVMLGEARLRVRIAGSA
jgi:FHA domain